MSTDQTVTTSEAPFDVMSLPPEERERYWYDNVYRGDVKQLTVRAILMGMVLGGVMSVSNLYVGLMTGWGFGVTITAGIMAYAFFKTFERWLPGGAFTDLENNAMQSVSSAAGFMASAGLTTAIPALMLLNGTKLGWVEMFVWIGAISMLGVVVAIPMKRQMINIDQLKFPSGIAAAETIKSLHGHGGEAEIKARSLALGGLLGATVAWFKDGHVEVFTRLADPKWYGEMAARIDAFMIPLPLIGPIKAPLAGVFSWLVAKCAPLAGLFAWVPRYSLPNQVPAEADKWERMVVTWKPAVPEAYKFGDIPWSKLTLGLDVSLLLYAAGAIIGMRTGLSLMIGAVINWFFIAPWLIQNQVPVLIKNQFAPIEGGFRQVVSWTTWPGTGMLVVATLVGLALQWKSLARGFSGITDIFRSSRSAPADDRAATIEVPGSWFLIGFTLAAIACVVLQYWLFSINPIIGVTAVMLAVILSMVTSRVTGETDISPTGAMGKVTQLLYGAISPGQPVTNLMTANVTAGAAIHSADLLTDLKSGYVLGANPRQQFLAQLFGVAAGTLFCVPAYFLLVPNAEVLGTKFSAPGALVWKATAEALSAGLSSIPPTAINFAMYTVTFGVIVTLLEAFVPKARPWLPSPTGLGLALVLQFSNSIAIFLGALTAWLVARARPEFAERHVVPFSSGVIAGESIIAVIVIALLVFMGAV